MILLIDNFDSFTYNLVDYFEQLGASCRVLRNNVPLSKIIQQDYSAIVFSPGPGRPEQAGVMMEALEHYAGRLPLLGVCLGHQAIGMHFGAKVIRAPRPMHGKVSKIRCTESLLFDGLPKSMDVVRYHSLVLENLPPVLECTATTAAGEIMALQHKKFPISGIQFHPEAALTENGLEILENWIAYYRLVD